MGLTVLPVYIRTIMSVLLPTERSSCTQRRTPRYIKSFRSSQYLKVFRWETVFTAPETQASAFL